MTKKELIKELNEIYGKIEDLDGQALDVVVKDIHAVRDQLSDFIGVLEDEEDK